MSDRARHKETALTMLNAWLMTGDWGYLARCKDSVDWLYNDRLRQVGEENATKARTNKRAGVGDSASRG